MVGVTPPKKTQDPSTPDGNREQTGRFLIKGRGTRHARELERGHRNRATLAVARKLAAYLLAVDKQAQPFQDAHSTASHHGAKSRLRKSCGDMEIQSTAIGFPHPHSSDCRCCRQFHFELACDRPAVSRPLGDCAEECLLPDAPSRLFRDRPFHPNSIFVDDALLPFPQMDVWPNLRFGRAERS